MDKKSINRSIEYFNKKILSEVGSQGYSRYYYYDLAIESLNKQCPTKCKVEYVKGQKSAKVQCPICDRKLIVNYKHHKEYYREWYCKRCGQRLIWGE